MARRSQKVLQILRGGFLRQFTSMTQEYPLGIELYNAVRRRWLGLSSGETSQLYRTGLAATRAAGNINRGETLLIGSIPTVPGLPSPTGANRRFQYEVTTFFRLPIEGAPEMVRKVSMESDSVLDATQIQQRIRQSLFNQFGPTGRKHYPGTDAAIDISVEINVRAVAARF